MSQINPHGNKSCTKAARKICHCILVEIHDSKFYDCCGWFHLVCGGRIENHDKVYDKNKLGKRAHAHALLPDVIKRTG
jgi:hypothetical protein